MQPLTCQEIRDKWIKFFTEKCESKHKLIASASLVPDNPTLLLNAAGMVQFVPIFMGTKPPPEPPRAVTIQKCARVGGKDSDLENIGRTTRHHSFFEMLGNFSFGDYFKAEAIPYAWQFVTEELGLDPARLYISVFKGDEQNDFDQEAYDIWLKVLEKDFPSIEDRKKRIWQMTRKDNFWGPPGATGPCGPCSEIYYDNGVSLSGKPQLLRYTNPSQSSLTPESTQPAQDSQALHLRALRTDSCEDMPELGSEEFDNRFTEIWNLVFMQFNKDEEGKFTPLENKNIDTGAGLERIATILQGVNNSFETDELFSVMSELAEKVSLDLGKEIRYEIAASQQATPRNDGGVGLPRVDNARNDTNLYLKIITDHLRCASFLIADGVRPSNVGRGYVLRMIIRRAARFLFLIRNKADAFLYKIADKLIENYSRAYPELKINAEQIKSVLEKEEEQFSKTIANGISKLEEELAKLKAGQKLDGEFVFDLYSTYGFPLELTQDMAQDKSVEVDLESYEKAKEAHSKASGTGAFDKSVESNAFVAEIIKEHGKTKFLGYDSLESKAKVIYVNEKRLVLDQTPFYAESGGQLADQGSINGKQVKKVKSIEGVFIHELEDTSGFSVGDEVEAKVDAKVREFTLKHHTSCHLLQAALRKVLGDSIQQMGSQVGPEYTRFDFNLDRGMTKDEIKQTQDLINGWISEKLPVNTLVMSYDDAVKAGALSFFEDKYDDEVRVLFVGNEIQNIFMKFPDARLASLEQAELTDASMMTAKDECNAADGTSGKGLTASVELCGGIHVSNLSEIDHVVIASEASVASGVRRIKLLANKLADDFIADREEAVKKQAEEEALKEKQKQEAKARAKEMAKLALEKVDELIASSEDNSGVKILIKNINENFPEGLDSETMKTLAEAITNKAEAFVLFASEQEGKAIFVAAASASLVKDKNSIYNAGNAVKEAARICGGGGGGRPNLAQAGGKDLGKINEALDLVTSLIKKEQTLI